MARAGRTRGNSGGRASARGRGAERVRLEAVAAPDSYARLSTRPLHILAFLAPLVIFYEVASALHAAGIARGAETIRAERILSDVFQIFGVGGLYLPGILLVVVLLVWHVINSDPWRIKWNVLGWMLLESVAWTVPLLVLGTIVWEMLHGRVVGTGSTPLAAAGVSAAGSGEVTRSFMNRVTIALGAGLYEELLFRMLAIGVFHAILVDVMGVKEKWGGIGAVVAAALAFGVYHDVRMDSGSINWRMLTYFVLAGLYFGMVYALRGFGIVVAVHALYDLAVLLKE